MTQPRPGQRRGLGRGLGSLIPTAPPQPPRDRDASGGAPEDEGDAATSPGVTAGVEPDGAGSDSAAAPPREARTTPSADHGGAEGLAPVEGAYFAEIAVAAITPNPRQPRQVFEEEALAELVHSVREVGLLQPVVVRPRGDDTYELIMGERRWRAIQEAGLSTIPAIVRETRDDEMLRDALLENLHRSQLNPLEEAAAYQQLLDDFGCTHEDLAGRIGRSRPQISNTLRLLKLSPSVQRRVAAGVLSAGHARALLAVGDADTQDRLAGRVVSEGISVRGLEEIVAVGDLHPDDKPRARPPKPHAPGLDDLAARLSDRLETRVKVALGRTKGKITVEFASIPDLERIVDILDPGNDQQE
jgi:ParB family chromosome partitioning protein